MCFASIPEIMAQDDNKTIPHFQLSPIPEVDQS